MTPNQSLPLLPMCICGNPTCMIPYGFCHCGCGKKTRLATVTRAGTINGLPKRFCHGHQATKHRPDSEELGHFKLNGVYCRLIPLTRGQYAIVWETDYSYIDQWRWYAQRTPDKKHHYAIRGDVDANGKKIKVRMHRVVLGLGHDNPLLGDHIRTDETLLNTRDNLRTADHVESQCNRSKPKNNPLGLKGVRWNKYKNKFQADLWYKGKHFNLGYSDTIEGAHEKYKAGLKKYHGAFGNSG